MFRNYLLVAIRSLRRHPGFTAINLVGLAVAAATALVLLLFLRQQSQMDAMHDDADNLYRVVSTFKASFNPGPNDYATSPASLGALVESDVAGIDDVLTLVRGLRGTAVVDGEGFSVRGLFAEPVFFDFFAFDLQSGDRETALNEPFSLILTPSVAMRLFGSTDVVGEVVPIDGNAYTITGVFGQDRYASHVALSAVASASTMDALPLAERLPVWHNSIYTSYTYLRLQPGADPVTIGGAIDALRPSHFGEIEENRLDALSLQAVRDISMGRVLDNQLGPVMNRSMAGMLLVIAVIILLAACFNYVGLAVSRSLRRAREVGVRKVFGARRTQLVGQFMAEAFLVSTISVALALGLFAWMVPAFNNLSMMQSLDARLDVAYGSDLGLYGVLILFILFVTVLAGLYPSLFLSRFRPSEAMKGQAGLTSGGGVWLRRSLVSVQFSSSAVFLILGLIVFSQSRYIRTADYGFTQENIVSVRLADVPFDRFADAVSTSPAVTDIAGTYLLPAMGSRADLMLTSDGQPEQRRGYLHLISDNFTDVLDLELIAGRLLDNERASDSTNAVLVNETLLQVLDMGTPEEAVGQSFNLSGQDALIAGVLKDFHADVPTMEIFPLVFALNPEALQWALVEIQPGSEDAALADIEAAWTRLGSTQALQSEALQAQLANSFVNQELKDTMRIIGLAAVLAVMIALLGMLGVATFTVERRTREISIRKVLGASVPDVLGLLSREFAVLALVSLAVAIPVAVMLGNAFLSDFALRIDIGIGIVTLGAMALVLLSFGAISTQTVRAALANPVDTLHAE